MRELKKIVERFCVHFVPGADIEETAKAVLEFSAERQPVDAHREESRKEIQEALAIAGGSKNGASEILGISGTACRSRLMRARIYLRKILDPEYVPQLAE